MSISYRAVSTGPSDNALPIVRNIPTGTVSGDYMLMQVSCNGAGVTPTVPAGWALLCSYLPSSTRTIFVYGKAVGASEPSTVSVGASSGSPYLNVGIITFTPSSGSPVVLDVYATQDNASSTNRSFPSVTTTIPNGVLVCLGCLGGATASTPDAAMTERWDTGTQIRNYMMTQSLSAAGATGTRTATGAAAIGSWVITLALGELSTITGNASITLSPVTLVASGSVPVTGAASVTLGALTVVAVGSVPVTGNAAMTLAPITVAAVGSVPVGGAAAITLGALTVTASGMLAPLAPTAFTATAIDGASIQLAWAGGGDAVTDSYSIERSADGVSGWTEIATTAALSFIDTGLSPGQTFYYRVRSVNS